MKYQILSLVVEINPHENPKYVVALFRHKDSPLALKKIFINDENLQAKVFRFASTIESHADKAAIQTLTKAIQV